MHVGFGSQLSPGGDGGANLFMKTDKQAPWRWLDSVKDKERRDKQVSLGWFSQTIGGGSDILSIYGHNS